MPTICLNTLISAPIDYVFDLSRSVELHQLSTAQTNEVAIAGRMSGLMELGETVTWRARHLGIYQNLTAKITEFDKPNFFVDELVEGAFKSFRHEHHFEIAQDGGTIMTDKFIYKSPLGFLGTIADYIFLETYMKKFLDKRNSMIKQIAESQHLVRNYNLNFNELEK